MTTSFFPWFTNGPLIAVQVMSGLSVGMFLFLLSVGMSLIFGVTRIVNLAHGSFYMVGAYLMAALIEVLPDNPVSFWIALVLAPIGVAVLGGVVEITLLRRVYRRDPMMQLILTFALILIIGTLVLLVWGPDNKSVARPEALAGSVRILGQPFPSYYLLVLGLSPLVAVGLWLVFYRTRWGMLVRAATVDREMLGALGVDVSRLLHSGVRLWQLAGRARRRAGSADRSGGARDGCRRPHQRFRRRRDRRTRKLCRHSDQRARGRRAAVLRNPHLPWRVDRPSLRAHGRGADDPAVGTSSANRRSDGMARATVMLAAALAIALVLPLALSAFYVVLLTEIAVAALFATAFNLLMGFGGMVSFGHAAYFALGAYAAALLAQKAEWPMLAAFAAAPLVAAFGAFVFGFFIVRLSHTYFAMLSLAFAQILYTIIFKWTSLTGGDNGLLNVWPPAFLRSVTAYYYFTLLVIGACFLALHAIVNSPFGYALKAIRENPGAPDLSE